MNERIKELAEEHGFIHEYMTIGERNDALIKYKEFAELIAYECIDLALGSSHREDDMGAIIANKIKKHFGVLE